MSDQLHRGSDQRPVMMMGSMKRDEETTPHLRSRAGAGRTEEQITCIIIIILQHLHNSWEYAGNYPGKINCLIKYS